MNDYINCDKCGQLTKKTANGIIQRGFQAQNISDVKRVWINIKVKIKLNKK